MLIRKANLVDLKEITDLIYECSKQFILPHFPIEGVQAYTESHSIEKMKERLQHQHFNYLVFENEQKKILGVVGVQLPSHLYHLHVMPEFHGLGIGRKLWETAKTVILKNNEPVKFTVNSSLNAVAFYERLGFISHAPQTINGVTYVPMDMKKTIVVHAIIKQNGKFLLAKRSLTKKHAAGYWASIGGRLEHNESLEECLIRECKEEIDITVKPIKKILEIVEPEANHFWFETEIISGIARLANDEHSEIQWFSHQEVTSLFPIVLEDLEIIQSSI